MSIYHEEFFVKRKKDVGNLLAWLQQCAYSGSWDNKVDFNSVIKRIEQDNILIEQLRQEIKRLEDKK